MKRPKDYTLLALAIPLIIALLAELTGCKSRRDYDYHLDVHSQRGAMLLYDQDDKLVGRIPDGNSTLDSLIEKDNQ